MGSRPITGGLAGAGMDLQKLNSTVTDPKINMSYNEKIEYALSALRTRGIHQDPQPSESVFSKVAHRIKREILDTENRFDPSPMMVTRAEPSSSPWWMAVLPRTALMFHILAIHLRCTIFVFSSRALPAIYRPAASRGTMIFFHAIDAFRGQSEFHVLQVKTSLEPLHILSSSMTPQTSSGSGSITAVTLPSPATLIGTPQVPQDPHLPFVPYATYRSGRRIRVRQPGLPNTEEVKEQCQEIYKMAW